MAQTFKLLTLAIAPTIFIVGYVYWRERFDAKQLSLMLKCYLLGGLAVILTLLISKIIKIAVHPHNQTTIDEMLYAFINVACVEEFSKYFFLRFYAYPKKEFYDPYDGITYSVAIAMGFASLENILYVMIQPSYYLSVYVGTIRSVTAIPAHAAMGVMMGYFVGMAKFQRSNRQFLLAGFLAAVIFHGCYDFFLFLHSYPYMSIGAFVSLIICVIISIKAINSYNKEALAEKRINIRKFHFRMIKTK
jgi:RsiW-degrading membrane proteinase PrsW (M82 family)